MDSAPAGPTVRSAIEVAAAHAGSNQKRYAELDAAAGDGDFGPVLARALRSARAAVRAEAAAGGAAVLTAAADAVAGVGGTTGPIWGEGLLQAAGVLRDGTDDPGRDATSATSATSLAARAARAAADGISALGGAVVGDKTLLDALVPAADALERAADDGTSLADAVRAAAYAAQQGAASTKDLDAKRGRASYQGEAAAGALDAGAVAIAEILDALARHLAGAQAGAEAPGAEALATDEGDEPGAAGEQTWEAVPGHLVDDPQALVDDALAGLVAASAGRLRWQPDPRFLARADAPVHGEVALVSGGGSGHEPLHGGFVGPGMLAAACPGEVFASPSAAQVVAAMRGVDAGAGVLLVVKNYTGDVLNFRLAAELAAAHGVRSETVLVADDVAVDGSTATIGRRGVAGTVVVEKLAGAAAARGDDLAAVTAVARRVADEVRSMGAAVSGVTLPTGGDPAIKLGEGEVELGVGIHGEPGRERISAEPAARLVDRLLDAVLADLPGSGSDLLLVTNGLGGLPLLELYAAHAHAVRRLEDEGLVIQRALVGPFVTSLGMAGLSLTLLRLDAELRQLWDAPVDTTAWRS